MLERGRADCQGNPPLGQSIAETFQLNFYDLDQVFGAEWMEDHEFIHSVQEFRAKMLPQLAHHNRPYLFMGRAVFLSLEEFLAEGAARVSELPAGAQRADSPAAQPAATGGGAFGAGHIAGEIAAGEGVNRHGSLCL